MSLDALRATFADPTLLDRALTHASYAHERGGADNERLEFLGDAVLQASVTTLLHERLPDAPEGVLTERRQQLVNTRVLADVARALSLGDALLLGRGEEQSGGRDKDTVLCDAFEALLGALYLDAGFDRLHAFVTASLEPWIARVDTLPAPALEAFNPKSRLQELTQGNGLGTPTYEVVGQDGPSHAPIWHVVVRVGGDVAGTGSGARKSDAERDAARAALDALR